MDFSKILNFIGKVAKNQVEEYIGDNFDINNSSNSSSYDIPLRYSDFPLYQGKMIDEPRETSTSNYSRLTIIYKGSLDKSYFNTLTSAGYQKASDVRFDKDNTYVIVESFGRNTKVAFHIKEN